MENVINMQDTDEFDPMSDPAERKVLFAAIDSFA